MTPRLADADARAHYPELDQCSTALFGLTADEAEAVVRPAGWDGAERKPLPVQVQLLEAAGWDVTDRRRPLRTLAHFNVQLWLALRGVAGRLPQGPADDSEEDAGAAAWGSALQAGAVRFKRDRR